MPYRIAVDTGGTFTDVVVSDESGQLHVGKALTTRSRAFQAISVALERVGEDLGVNPRQLLEKASQFTYGTTRSTNAIVEGMTARTAFLTTEGFPDTLVFREGGKHNPFKQLPYPKPYIPQDQTFEVRERVDAEGTVYIKLDEDSLLAALDQAKARSCEAIGVCLMWSVANPAHELRVGELIEQHMPGIPYTLSHQLNPIVREYRRASSTVIDASLKPLMQDFISTLEQDLSEAGFDGELFIATSFGGSWQPSEVREQPIYSVGSGPSMAPVAALNYGEVEDVNEGSRPNLLVCDTGGTTFDVSLVSCGDIHYSSENWLGGKWVGHITGTRAVDVKSIGAGGGSIVWIDSGGLLRVGPYSAGAEPGPACYGGGGTEPTVTDAALLLGYLDPDWFLGGRLTLDVEASRNVFEPVAAQIGKSIVEAAQAAMRVATENVIAAVREITISQGIDPRDMTVVAGGGASGLNVGLIAEELGCNKVLIPGTAGALSATGGLLSDIISEFQVNHYKETRQEDHSSVNRSLEDAERRADAFLAQLGDTPKRTSKEYSVEARYPRQVWEIDVALPSSRLNTLEDIKALEAVFHETHQRIFAVHEPGQYLECLVWKVRATAELQKPSMRSAAVHEAFDSRESHSAEAYFEGLGRVEVPRYDGEKLPEDTYIEGPAIINEATTTIVVYPGSSVRVTPLRNYLMEIGGANPNTHKLGDREETAR